MFKCIWYKSCFERDGRVSQVWVTLTEELLGMLTEVRVLPLCTILMIVAPVTPTELPVERPAEAPVKVTVPKLVRVTREPPSSKSSTIHSAFWPARAAFNK